MTSNITGRIFNIQRYSLHDGDGIRTVVFFKGCPLKCLWCSNPESQQSKPEVGFIDVRCSAPDCKSTPCKAACANGSIQLTKVRQPLINRDTCDSCGACAQACGDDAIKLVGTQMTVDQVMAELAKDQSFYRRSGGGITLSGGEPLAQPKFAAALLEAAGQEYLHTAMETSGHAAWSNFEAVLQHVDLLQIDIKHMDPQRHKELTGQSNELILDNLRRVPTVMDPEDVIIRIPVIPLCNDSIENMTATAEFVAEAGFKNMELIPYHKLGVSKYRQYGLEYLLKSTVSKPDLDFNNLRWVIRQYGLRDVTGVN